MKMKMKMKKKKKKKKKKEEGRRKRRGKIQGYRVLNGHKFSLKPIASGTGLSITWREGLVEMDWRFSIIASLAAMNWCTSSGLLSVIWSDHSPAHLSLSAWNFAPELPTVQWGKESWYETLRIEGTGTPLSMSRRKRYSGEVSV
jgi:hypothetical protein